MNNNICKHEYAGRTMFVPAYIAGTVQYASFLIPMYEAGAPYAY